MRKEGGEKKPNDTYLWGHCPSRKEGTASQRLDSGPSNAGGEGEKYPRKNGRTRATGRKNSAESSIMPSRKGGGKKVKNTWGWVPRTEYKNLMGGQKEKREERRRSVCAF